MDAEALRMMADLGLERRDLVSAPEEIPRGRDCHDESREQAAVAAAFEARRTRNSFDDVEGGDERAARLRAWNTQTTFENDEVIGQLENRWSGQGHRARLNRQLLSCEDPWESIDARYGEERRLYLQGKCDELNNSTPSKPRNGGKDRFSEDIFRSYAASPRTFNGSHHHDRSRAAPRPRATGHTRAPSPRSFGTVRFAQGGRCTERNALVPKPVVNPGLQAAAALRATAAKNSPESTSSTPTRLEAGTRDQGVASYAATGSSMHAPPCHTNFLNDTAIKQHHLVSNTGAQATAVLRTHVANVSSDQQSTPNSSSSAVLDTAAAHAQPAAPSIVAHDPRVADMCRNLALWYAAHPGEECNKYHEKYPDRLQYLGPARDKLISEAIGLAKRNDEHEIAEELKRHPERGWMVDAAKRARFQVEYDSDAQIQKYCATHPRQRVFVNAAKAVFSPTKTTALDAQRSSSETTTDSSSLSSDTDDTAETAASSPPRSRLGTLVAVFFDVAGNFLGNHHVGVDVPVQATINMTSRAQCFNPRELIVAIESLAQSMVDRTQGLEGVRLAEDGLWVEGE